MGKSRELSDYANKQTTKNTIINGNFDIWQRGTSLIAGTGTRYLSDRWANESVGTTMTPSRETILPGDILKATHFHRNIVTSVVGTGNYASLLTKIENVSTHAGEKVTLSFYAKSDAPKNIASDLRQEFGTGGTPSTTITGIGVTTYALTTNWQKFTATFNVPSISGKTIGTNNDNFLELVFWFESGSNNDARTNALGQQSGTFDIAQVQIESGGIASDFDLRTFTEELILCHRYYEKSYDIDQIPGSIVSLGQYSVRSTGAFNYPFTYNWFEKRVIPTITFYNPATGTPGQLRDNTINRGVVGLRVNTKNMGEISVTSPPTLANVLIFHLVIDAEL